MYRVIGMASCIKSWQVKNQTIFPVNNDTTTCCTITSAWRERKKCVRKWPIIVPMLLPLCVSQSYWRKKTFLLLVLFFHFRHFFFSFTSCQTFFYHDPHVYYVRIKLKKEREEENSLCSVGKIACNYLMLLLILSFYWTFINCVTLSLLDL